MSPRKIDFIAYQKEEQLAAHAIGLDHKRPYLRHGKFFYRPYRNRFVTHDKAPDFKIWQDMVANGYAGVYSCCSGVSRFYLTRKGQDWLGEAIHITIRDEGD